MSKPKFRFSRKLLAIPYGLFLAVFVLIPLLLIIYFSFTDASGNFTLDNFMQIGRYKKPFILSITYAFIATIITLLLASKDSPN